MRSSCRDSLRLCAVSFVKCHLCVFLFVVDCVAHFRSLVAHQSVTEEGKNETDIPDFDFLVNFPRIGRAQRGHDERLCVMCGNTRPFVKSRPEGDGSTPYILRNVKGVCSSCEVTVWVTSRGVRVKFCDQCSNFRPLQCFAAKDPGKSRNGIVNSCLDCRATKNGPRNNKKDNESNSPQKKKRAAKPTEPQKPRSVIAPVSLHRCIPVSALSDIDHSRWVQYGVFAARFF